MIAMEVTLDLDLLHQGLVGGGEHAIPLLGAINYGPGGGLFYRYSSPP